MSLSDLDEMKIIRNRYTSVYVNYTLIEKQIIWIHLSHFKLINNYYE